jgi:hypothetical protein
MATEAAAADTARRDAMGAAGHGTLARAGDVVAGGLRDMWERAGRPATIPTKLFDADAFAEAAAAAFLEARPSLGGGAKPPGKVAAMVARLLAMREAEAATKAEVEDMARRAAEARAERCRTLGRYWATTAATPADLRTFLEGVPGCAWPVVADAHRWALRKAGLAHAPLAAIDAEAFAEGVGEALSEAKKKREGPRVKRWPSALLLPC